MKRIKLMVDYDCYPLWLDSDDEVGNIDPDVLPISDSLKEELNNWSKQYDETLNLDDPLSSGFSTPEAETVFKEKGQYLREKLQTELNNGYEVIYQQ
ncbi:hypothetical protein [Photorhabdus sp. RW14-46]|uniref:hypothetical protein n=1 Tax=Photorhabdus sp. RW14-46 TaxID=2100168 RepID=UPI0013F3ED70|nr:hypothetical protein [Photorhabdus sp. RW14-46]NHB62293.1 hypothetical protein [Photorhabdus sp. RW14-46]